MDAPGGLGPFAATVLQAAQPLHAFGHFLADAEVGPDDERRLVAAMAAHQHIPAARMAVLRSLPEAHHAPQTPGTLTLRQGAAAVGRFAAAGGPGLAELTVETAAWAAPDIAAVRSLLLPTPGLRQGLAGIVTALQSVDEAPPLKALCVEHAPAPAYAPPVAPVAPAPVSPPPFVPTPGPVAKVVPSVAPPMPPAPSAPAATAGAVPAQTVLRGAASVPAVAPPQGGDQPPAAPFDPEHPQRVTGSTAAKVVRRLRRDGTSAALDLKYDGERLLALKLTTGLRCFSRNMLAVPERKLGGVTELLTGAFGANAVVIDAEILSSHTQGSMNRASKADILASGPRIYVFDLLWANGVSLTGLPMAQRRQQLQQLMRPMQGKVEFPESWTLDLNAPDGGAAALVAVARSVLSCGLEGVVAKPMDAPYRHGGTSWVKIKAGYLDDLAPGGPSDPTGILHAANAAAGAAVPPRPAGPPREVPLKDTLDCIAVGHKGPQLLLACRHTHSGAYVTVGYATCPPHCGVVLTPAALRKYTKARGVPYCKVHPDLAPEAAFAHAAQCPVVEVRAARLVESHVHSCEQLALSSDATVVRPRPDKAYDTGVTTSTAVAQLFAAGLTREVPTLAAVLQEANALSADPKAPMTPTPPTVLRGTKGAVAAAERSIPAGAKAVVCVLVAPGRPWSNRGVMGRVSRSFGPELGAACDATMQHSNRGGDLAAVSARSEAVVLLALGALEAGVQGRPPKLDMFALDTALRKVDALLVRLRAMGGAGASVVAHIDAPVDAADATALQEAAAKWCPSLTLHAAA